MNFTLCGHQCQSIARQMGLFEVDSVEASSKLLNVGSIININENQRPLASFEEKI